MISPLRPSASWMAISVLPTAVGPTTRIRGAWLSVIRHVRGQECRGGPCATVRTSRKCILKMHDLDLVPGTLHGDHVDLPVVDGILLRVIIGASQHMSLLARRDRHLGRAKGLARSRLHLNEGCHAILVGDQIDLAVRRPDVAPQDLIAMLAKEILCSLFDQLSRRGREA